MAKYIGDAVRADRWGELQVRTLIEGGRIVKIDFVKFPQSTRRSITISNAALPTMVNEAIQNPGRAGGYHLARHGYGIRIQGVARIRLDRRYTVGAP